MAVKKKTELLVAQNVVSCPLCLTLCVPLSADGNRVIVKHSANDACANKGKIWAIQQPTVSVEEI